MKRSKALKKNKNKMCVQRRYRVGVSAFALLSSLAFGSPVVAKTIVNDKENTINSRQCTGMGGVSAAMCVDDATVDGVTNSGTIALDYASQNYVSGISIGQGADAAAITVKNEAGASISATGKRAYGVEVYPRASETINIVNEEGAEIAVTSTAPSRNFADGGLTDASASGIFAYMEHDDKNTVSMTNNGTVSAASSGTNVYASGMEIWAGVSSGSGYTKNNSGTLINTGTIRSVSTGDTAMAMGVYSVLDGNSNVTTISNDGLIDAKATGLGGGAYGILTKVGRGSVSTVYNTGIINVSGDNAHELYVSNQIITHGGGTANVAAWNLLLRSGTVADTQKTFKVDMGATLNFGNGETGDKAAGAHLILRPDGYDHSSSEVSELVYNAGGTVTGIIDSASAGGADASAYQATVEGYGSYDKQQIYLDRVGQVNLDGSTLGSTICATVSCALYSSTSGLGLYNAGSIDVTGGANETVAGMHVNWRGAKLGTNVASLTNAGDIAVAADGTNGKAYGVYARLHNSDQVVDISSRGDVSVSGATAHQLYVTGEAGIGGGTANLKQWNLILLDRVSDNQSPFAVADGATLNFSNTDMLLRPGADGTTFENGKKFNVANMVQNYGNGAKVTGWIGSVHSVLPMLEAKCGLIGGSAASDCGGKNNASGGNWDEQWVSLDVNADKSDGPTVDSGVSDSMLGQAERVGSLLNGGSSGSGVGFGDGGLNPVRLKIYYGNQQRRGIGASVTDSTGAVAYADYEVGDGHTLGWHAGGEYSNLRARSRTLSINSLSGILGGQGRYNITNSAYLRGQVSGVLSSNNNHFRAFDGSTSKVSTVNFGLYGAMYAGYDYEPDDQNTITPELGISALWSHIPSMDVKYDNNPSLNHSYTAQNYTSTYANASLRWSGSFDIDGTIVRPTLMAGVRQTLGDGKIQSALTYAGNRYASSITRDRTVGIVDVGVNIPVSASFEFGLSYRGEYGQNTTNHIGYLNGTIRF